jgi:hypothetical protein
MASNNSVHLSDEQLALFEDGELSGRESSHLESCPECSRRLRARRAAAAAYVEYRDSIRGPLLPPVPKPWPSLDTLIRENQGTKRAGTFRWWPAPALAMAVCLVLAVVVLHKVFPNGEARESARANELLTESAQVELPEGRLISLRVRGQTLVRPAVLITEGRADNGPGMADVEMAFASAHYSWREPLSARSFQAWRRGLKNKRDFVSMIRGHDEKEAYRVRTDSPAGTLRSASLTLRVKDLRPTDGTFEFEALGTVELAETATPAALAVPDHASSEPVSTASPHTETLAGPEDTLHVLAALDQIGADVGEPVNVSEDAQHQHVVVRANGLDQERRQQIAQALTPLPRVILDLTSSDSSPRPIRPATPETYSTSIPEAVRQQLDDRLGGAAARQEITDRVLEASASALARAHALEVLADKFPPETEARLAAQDRELLRNLRDGHTAELGRLVAKIRSDLQPLLVSSASPPPYVTDNGTGRPWQAGILALVVSAQETDKLLNRLLAGSYSQSSGEEMLRGLSSQIDRFERAVQSQRQQGR